jgi:hypothetical protein
MNKVLLLVFLAVLSLNLKGQDSKEFIGKWKIVAVNMGVYYNYKNDSSFVTKKFSDSLVGRKDSAETVDLFLSFAQQYADYYFIFAEQGNYKEIRDGEMRIEGKYAIDKRKKTIDLLLKRGDKEIPASYKFIFENKNLKIFMSSTLWNDELELTVEKSE